MIQFFIFFLGLIVGSFLNCVIYRLEKEESFLKGRSYCPHCRHKLGFLDLIPVLSFILLRGRCRYCQKPISIQYPLIELTTGIIFILLFVFSFALLVFIISAFLIVIFIYDLKHYIIPDKIVFPAIGLALIYDLYLGFTKSPLILKDFVNPLISALGAAAFFAAIVLLSRGRWMGVGDIKLAFLMGLILGWPNIAVALFLAFMTGAIIGVGLMVFGKKTMRSEVPFGPFLVFGTFTALFYGQKIINWYVQIFYFN